MSNQIDPVDPAGSETPVFRVNAAFQGIEIPEGSHRVRVYYDDARWKAGLGISLFTLAGLIWRFRTSNG